MTEECQPVPFTFKSFALPPHITCLAYPDWPSNPKRVEMRDEEASKYVPLESDCSRSEIQQAYRTLVHARVDKQFGGIRSLSAVMLYSSQSDLTDEQFDAIAAELERLFGGYLPQDREAVQVARKRRAVAKMAS